MVGGGRGVYVNRRFRAGEWVCLYGGILTFEDELRKRPHDQQQHARRTGNPQLALDGYPLASLFLRLRAMRRRSSARQLRIGAIFYLPTTPVRFPILASPASPDSTRPPPPSQETVISLIARA